MTEYAIRINPSTMPPGGVKSYCHAEVVTKADGTVIAVGKMCEGEKNALEASLK